MGEVVPFTGLTTLDIDPDAILQANVGRFETVILLGVAKGTGKATFCSSISDTGELLRLAGRFTKFLIDQDEASEGE